MKASLSLAFSVILSGSLLSQSVLNVNYEFKATTFNNVGLYSLGANNARSGTPKHIAHSLRGKLEISSNLDSLYIDFWDIVGTDPYFANPDTLNTNDNRVTFSYELQNTPIKMPFRGSGYSKVTIPFRYRLEPDADLEADFLSLGYTGMLFFGKTTFSRSLEPKSWYIGIGAFSAFSGTKIDSSSTGGYLKNEKNVATFSYGLNAVLNYHKLTFLVSLGFDNAIGKSAKHWGYNNFTYGTFPWIGFGIGFDLIDGILFKEQTNEN